MTIQERETRDDLLVPKTAAALGGLRIRGLGHQVDHVAGP